MVEAGFHAAQGDRDGTHRQCVTYRYCVDVCSLLALNHDQKASLCPKAPAKEGISQQHYIVIAVVGFFSLQVGEVSGCSMFCST